MKLTKHAASFIFLLLAMSLLINFSLINEAKATDWLKTVKNGGLTKIGAVYGQTTATPDSLILIIAKIIKASLGLLGIIFVILMLYAGFTWMTAGGEEEKINKSQRHNSTRYNWFNNNCSFLFYSSFCC
ncbi:MAG: hypothetical protein ABH818_00180 [Patescibacteria group bacterium]|nr:hypothetical protein [Patescibacteria group bacterium]